MYSHGLCRLINRRIAEIDKVYRYTFGGLTSISFHVTSGATNGTLYGYKRSFSTYSDELVEKLTSEDLYNIDDYHEYIYARVLDVNGTKRSILQRLLPVDSVHDALMVLHDFTNLPWCLTITLTTLLLKVAMLPLWISAERARRKNAYLIPEAIELKQRFKEAYATGDTKAAQEIQTRLFTIMGGKSFIRSAIIQVTAAISQGIMFGSVYGGLRLFAINPRECPSFTFESPLWLDSLALPDPYYILPSIFGMLLTIISEHSHETAEKMKRNQKIDPKNTELVKQERRQEIFKSVSRGGIIIFTTFGFFMPASAFFYLLPSFLFQTLVRYSLYNFKVSKFFDVPMPIIKESPSSKRKK